KTTEIQQTSDATANSRIDDELDNEKLERMDILLLVIPSDGMKYPSKRLTLSTMEFEKFRLQLVHEARRIDRIRSEDLLFAYRSTKIR
ncbi:950_t:CDS:1, partial [Paraglomus brasilianum]